MLIEQYFLTKFCWYFSRPGVYEVQQLSSGARHASVFTGKSVIFIFTYPCLPLSTPIWFIRLTLSAVNPQPRMDSKPSTVLSFLHTTFLLSPRPWVRAEKLERRHLWPQILVWGSRVVDLSTSPLTRALALVAWAKLMRRVNVDLMVLCIDYPSPLCCLVGVLLPSLFSCCRIHEY